MALNPTVMRDLVVAKVQAATGNQLPQISKDVWLAVCDAIISHITAAAVVTSSVTVISVTGVTPGSPVSVSGPGTGTATGGIS